MCSRSTGKSRSLTTSERRERTPSGITETTSLRRSVRPILAVSDGRLFSVGWNHLGGQRLWLRDTQGNEYVRPSRPIHPWPSTERSSRRETSSALSATPATRLAPVPSPLRVHPKALLGLGYDGVINPYPYLVAWHARQDEDFRVSLPAQAGGALQPAAVVIETNDISTASGLDQKALERVLALPALFEGLAAAQPVVESASGRRPAGLPHVDALTRRRSCRRRGRSSRRRRPRLRPSRTTPPRTRGTGIPPRSQTARRLCGAAGRV